MIGEKYSQTMEKIYSVSLSLQCKNFNLKNLLILYFNEKRLMLDPC